MSISRAELEAQALLLAPEERVQLTDRLLASLSSTGEIDEAWSVEAERRLEELENGSVVGVRIEDAIARARRAIK